MVRNVAVSCFVGVAACFLLASCHSASFSKMLIKPMAVKEMTAMNQTLAADLVDSLKDASRFSEPHGIRQVTVDPYSVKFEGNYQYYLLFQDIKQIETDEIFEYVPSSPAPLHYYQCALIQRAHEPFYAQSEDPVNIERIARAFAFLAGNVPITHQRFVNQGIDLQPGTNIVSKLYVGSPLEQAGVLLGDELWSVDENPPHAQGRGIILGVLALGKPGRHSLYVVDQRAVQAALQIHDQDQSVDRHGAPLSNADLSLDEARERAPRRKIVFDIAAGDGR